MRLLKDALVDPLEHFLYLEPWMPVLLFLVLSVVIGAGVLTVVLIRRKKRKKEKEK